MSMSKEEIMSISSYEEFDRKREQIRGTKWDKEMMCHIGEFFKGKLYDGDLFYTEPPDKKY